jgi:hypothetical protein
MTIGMLVSVSLLLVFLIVLVFLFIHRHEQLHEKVDGVVDRLDSVAVNVNRAVASGIAAATADVSRAAQSVRDAAGPIVANLPPPVKTDPPSASGQADQVAKKP